VGSEVQDLRNTDVSFVVSLAEHRLYNLVPVVCLFPDTLSRKFYLVIVSSTKIYITSASFKR
jgi:hypothetical protein